MAKLTGILADVMNDINGDRQSGNVQYIKDGDTTLKLVLPEGRTFFDKATQKGFYEKFISLYEGKPVVNYLVAAVITEASEDGVANPSVIRYVRVTGGILANIIKYIERKWKLFDVEGRTITITRSTKSGKTEYSLMGNDETFNTADCTYPDETIEEAARAQEIRSANKDAELNKGEELK